MEPTGVMRRVWSTCFNGDWAAMQEYARNYDPEVINGSDPEVNGSEGNGYAYPMLKTFTFGINATF